MTDEQREKRMAELLWSCDSYEEMCQRVVAMEDAVDRICDGYEKLSERVEGLEAENEKLRMLAEKAWKTAERLCQAYDGPCSDKGVMTAYKPCPLGERDEECVYGLLQRDLCELGVEVSDA